VSTIEDERNLIGIPIEGSITGVGERRVQQLPIEDLLPFLKAIHDDPGIESFGWRQYTPYFNDGEQCVFGVGNVWFLTPEDAVDEEDQKLRADDYHTWEEEHGYTARKGFARQVDIWTYPETGRPWKKAQDNPRWDQRRYERCEVFCELLYSDHFDLALLAKFGDHAIVTINKDKITVEYYEHE
jgi:hypothetical protein